MALTYAYPDLPCERSIRVIHLEPARTIYQQLQCRLSAVPLDSCPEYHALSYVWGVPAPDQMESISIHLPQQGGTASLAITPNCAAALRHLRLPRKTRTLWVDAICINQASNKEKSTQVKMMTDIYCLASRVVVWLDLGLMDRRKGMQLIRLITRVGYLTLKGITFWPGGTESRKKLGIVSRLCNNYCDRSANEMSDAGNEKNTYPRHPDLETLLQFLANPYFSRAWTVQELAMAKLHHTVVVTQYGIMHWKYLWAASDYIFTALRTPALLGFDLRLFARWQTEVRSHFLISFDRTISRDHGVRIGLLDTGGAYVENAVSDPFLNASLPVDKVYATIWRLSSHNSDLKPNSKGQRGLSFFDVDYDKPSSQVFTEYAAAIFQIYGSCSLIEEVLTLAAMTARETAGSLPSWVPGWDDARSLEAALQARTILQTNRGTDAQAGGPACQRATPSLQVRSGRLCVRGLPVTNVSSVFSFVDEQTGTESREIHGDLSPPSASVQSKFREMVFIWTETLAKVLQELARQCHGPDHLDVYDRLLQFAYVIDDCESPKTLERYPSDAEKRLVRETTLPLSVIRLKFLMDLSLACLETGTLDSPDKTRFDLSRVSAVVGTYLSDHRLREIAAEAARAQNPAAYMIAKIMLEHSIEAPIVYVALWISWLRGRTLFFTQCGRMGTAVKCEPGDEVAVWEGVRCPVVVRRQPDNTEGDETWSMVSPVYVEGMMGGEEFDEDKCVDFVVV